MRLTQRNKWYLVGAVASFTVAAATVIGAGTLLYEPIQKHYSLNLLNPEARKEAALQDVRERRKKDLRTIGKQLVECGWNERARDAKVGTEPNEAAITLCLNGGEAMLAITESSDNTTLAQADFKHYKSTLPLIGLFVLAVISCSECIRKLFDPIKGILVRESESVESGKGEQS